MWSGASNPWAGSGTSSRKPTPPAPPPSGGVGGGLFGSPTNTCSVFEQARWEQRKRCLETAWGGGAYPWVSVFDWCRDYNRPVGLEALMIGTDPAGLAEWGLENCGCAHTKWLLDDPREWPESVRNDLERVCEYTAPIWVSLIEEPSAGMGPARDLSTPKVRCAFLNWDSFDLDGMMDPGTGECSEWKNPVGPCERVFWGDSLGGQNCGGFSLASVSPESAPSALSDFVDAVQCGCYSTADFGGSCYCGAATVSCKWVGGRNGYCQCSGACDKSDPECVGPATFSTPMQACEE